MTIINTSHPIKLAFGSKRISGIPKFARSASGSNSMAVAPLHISIIRIKVKQEVRAAQRSALPSSCLISSGRTKSLIAINHPTGRPKSMQKNGTPMPSPAQMISRKTKSAITHPLRMEIILSILMQSNDDIFKLIKTI